MKSLEGYTIELVKKMSHEELIVLWNKIAEEKQAMDIRTTIVNMLDVMEAQQPLIES